MMVRRSKEGQQAYKRFKSERCRCSTCWLCQRNYPMLDVHHIVPRRGVIYDDLRNFFAACRMCHSMIEVDGIVWDGERVAQIPESRILRVKRRLDPKHWDLAFLRLLAGPGDGRLNMEFGRGLE